MERAGVAVKYVIRHTVTSSPINHKYIYSGECCYACEVCNTAFIQQSSLNIHQHMHIVEGAENWLAFSGNE